MKITLKVNNMNCAMCASSIEKYFKNSLYTPKILLSHKKVIFSVPENTDYNILIHELKKIGFNAKLDTKNNLNKKNYEIFRLIFATILVLPFLYLLIGKLNTNIVPNFFYNKWFNLVLATIMQFFIGYRFYKNSFYQIKTLRLGMDTLVSLGSSTAYFYSLYLLIFTNNTNFLFHTSSMIIWMISIGNFIEDITVSKTNQSLSNLLDLKVDKVRLIKNNKEEIVELEKVIKGDIIRVLANEKIPLDGIIINGDSYVDQSIITGEDIPVAKKINSNVIGSSINLTNTLLIKVTKVGSETVLNKLIDSVIKTNQIKPKVAKIVDVVSKWLVISVTLIAIFAFLVNYLLRNKGIDQAILSAISVLVVSCPCALGLATPTSIAVASGIAFKNKILFKDAKLLELAHKIDCICFDKTGTITTGKLRVEKFFGDINTLKYTKSIEKHSNHPISTAINNYMPEIVSKNITKFKQVIGLGVSAKLEKNNIYCGSLEYMQSLNIKINYKNEYINYTNKGYISIFTALNNEVVNLIVLSDTIKDDAINTINKLKKLKITPYLITGDNINTAKNIAQKVGIENVYANILPNEKAKLVKELKKTYKTLAFCGDGINDIVALTEADISFSVSNATEQAGDCSSVLLLDNNLENVLKAISISKKTKINIIENLVWSFLYNSISIPLAFLLISPPTFSSLIHIFSSILVVLNALRLKLNKF